jgi:hypothetical protein
MPRINHFLVYAAICLAASSTPLEKLAARGTFSLQQVAVQPKEPLSLAEVVARHYWKYGFDAPKAIERLIQNDEAIRAVNRLAEPGSGGSGSVAAAPFEGEKLYLIETQVGKHRMKLDLDTGSADLYVCNHFHCVLSSFHFCGRHVWNHRMLTATLAGFCQQILRLHTNPDLVQIACMIPEAVQS